MCVSLCHLSCMLHSFSLVATTFVFPFSFYFSQSFHHTIIYQVWILGCVLFYVLSPPFRRFLPDHLALLFSKNGLAYSTVFVIASIVVFFVKGKITIVDGLKRFTVSGTTLWSTHLFCAKSRVLQGQQHACRAARDSRLIREWSHCMCMQVYTAGGFHGGVRSCVSVFDSQTKPIARRTSEWFCAIFWWYHYTDFQGGRRRCDTSHTWCLLAVVPGQRQGVKMRSASHIAAGSFQCSAENSAVFTRKVKNSPSVRRSAAI